MSRTAEPVEPLSRPSVADQTIARPPASRSGTAPTARSEQETRPGGTRARAKRLPQIDVMRLIVCFFVVATHVVSNANPMEAVAPNAIVNVLHFTRQAFFFISALVLVHSSWGRVGADGRLAEEAGQMRKRVSVLGVPYLLWSAFYVVLGLVTAYSLWAAKRLWWTYLEGLVQGTDGYHMYFLLVSVEFAVIFPLFVRLLHATRNHHRTLLIVSGLVEVALMGVYHYIGQPEGWWRPFIGEASLTAYQFWVVLGGVAALHFEQMHAWLTRHTWLVVNSLVGITLVGTGLFFLDLAMGEQPEYAGRSIQPMTVPLSLATIGALYLLSVRIANMRAGWAQRALVTGTYLSFGIYLSHPAILTGLLYLQKALPGGVSYHPVTVTTVILVVDFVAALAVSQVLSRTRWSKALIGRPMRRVRPASSEPSPVERGVPARAVG
jgi:peptidoglycan/LPS O-acetylase OafA/YrhL